MRRITSELRAPLVEIEGFTFAVFFILLFTVFDMEKPRRYSGKKDVTLFQVIFLLISACFSIVRTFLRVFSWNRGTQSPS